LYFTIHSVDDDDDDNDEPKVGDAATEGSEIAMPSWPMIEYRAET
jgi:hypothetical protein